MGIARLDKLKRNIQTLPINDIIGEALEKNSKEVEKLVTDQLVEGLRGDGVDMKKYRSEKYAAFKSRIGSKSSPKADLKLTGNYHKSLKQKVFKDKAEIFSTDNKDKLLTKKYGTPIKEIRDKKQRINPIIIKDVRNLTRKFIFNG